MSDRNKLRTEKQTKIYVHKIILFYHTINGIFNSTRQCTITLGTLSFIQSQYRTPRLVDNTTDGTRSYLKINEHGLYRSVCLT